MLLPERTNTDFPILSYDFTRKEDGTHDIQT